MTLLRGWLIVLSGLSAAAMSYVGAYQIRAIDHMSCPLLNGGCEAVADAPFARPGGIPDGFIAAGMYVVLILLALTGVTITGARRVRRYIRTVAVLAGIANVMGVVDMAGLGAWCFYCLLTTVFSPVLVWLAYRT